MSGRDPEAALIRALQASAAAAGCPARLLSADVRDWASATFTGHRHRIRLALTSPATTEWLATLCDAEWRLPGHIVIDLVTGDVAAAGDEHHATVHALTIRDL